MKMESLKQHLKNSVNKILILLFIFISLMGGCKRLSKFGGINGNYPSGHGFTLQRFDVISTQLKSIVHEYKKERKKDEDIATVLYLNLNDSAEVVVGMISLDKRYDTISKKHIFEPNNRIVGFMVVEKDTLIVLSNIEHIVDFSIKAYKFIRPTNDKQYFDYIYFPDDLYCLTDENGIPCPPELYDPFPTWYIFKNNEFIFKDMRE